MLAANSYAYGETVTLTIRDVETGAKHTIISNRIHPFYVRTAGSELSLVANGGARPGTIATGSWIEAQHLAIGARLLDADGTASEVIGKSIESAPLQAYNLTVADFHTYFVAGADNDNAPGVWVHNCNLASWRKVAINMEEVISGHTRNGYRAIQSGKKDVFADGMSESAIERLIRHAYRNAERIPGGQGSTILLQGTHRGTTVQMYYNRATRTIETAWPKVFSR